MVNPGGSTAEPAVVSGHTRTAVVLNKALGYYHEIRELVVQGLSAQKERSDEEDNVDERRSDITEDVSGLGNSYRSCGSLLVPLSWCRCVCPRASTTVVGWLGELRVGVVVAFVCCVSKCVRTCMFVVCAIVCVYVCCVC